MRRTFVRFPGDTTSLISLERKWSMPWMLGAGLAFRPSENMTLAFDYERRNYSSSEFTYNGTTSSGSKYDIHLASKEHISKSRSKAFYCKPCETQSRSQLEHENHCNSSKHKKKTGEIVEPENYHCEPCNFTTPSKHLFKQHNEGKKHKKKMSSGGS